MYALYALILVLSFAPFVVALLHVMVGITLRADSLLARLDTVRILTTPQPPQSHDSNLYNQVLEAFFNVFKFASRQKVLEIFDVQKNNYGTERAEKDVIKVFVDIHRDWWWRTKTFFAKARYVVPSLVVSLLYFFSFMAILPEMCSAKLPWLGSIYYGDLYAQLSNSDFKKAHLYLIYTFVGSYVYNSGIMIRRTFTWDVSGQMFWWAAYHVVLSIGLAAVVNATTKGIDEHLYFLFAMASASILDGLTRELRAKLFQAATVPSASESSLQLISGIDYWKAQRLMEEGIEDIQHLATADFIVLALYTRTPLPTVTDWVDQAIFIHRFPGVERKMLDAGLPVSAVRLLWAWQGRRESPSYEGSYPSFENYLKRLTEATGVKEEVLVRTLESWERDNQVRFLSLFCEVDPASAHCTSQQEDQVSTDPNATPEQD